MPDADIALTRVDVVGSMGAGPQQASPSCGPTWDRDHVAQHPPNRPLGVAFMLVAGVIGYYGVLDNNSILIVGADGGRPDLFRSPRSP